MINLRKGLAYVAFAGLGIFGVESADAQNNISIYDIRAGRPQIKIEHFLRAGERIVDVATYDKTSTFLYIDGPDADSDADFVVKYTPYFESPTGEWKVHSREIKIREIPKPENPEKERVPNSLPQRSYIIKQA